MTRLIDRWLFEEFRVSRQSLAIFRVTFAVVVFAFYFPDFEWTTRLPTTFFSPPPGPFRLLDTPLSAPALRLVEVAIAICLVFVLFGFRTKAAGVTLTLLLVFGYGIVYSFGQIHHYMALYLLPAVGGLAGWGESMSIDARARAREPEPPGRPWLAIFAVALGLMMLSAGFPKLRTGWLDSSSYGVWMPMASARPRGESPVLLDFAGRVIPQGSWELLDWFTVWFELLFITAMARLSTVRVALGLAAAFHLGIFFLTDISFIANVLAYGLFVEWARVAGPLRAALPKVRGFLARVRPWHLVTLGVVAWGIQQAARPVGRGGGVAWALIPQTAATQQGVNFVVLALAVVVALVGLGRRLSGARLTH